MKLYNTYAEAAEDNQGSQIITTGPNWAWNGEGYPPVGCKINTPHGIAEVISVSDFGGGVVTYAYEVELESEIRIACIWNKSAWISPLETPEQKKEREELEAAYDLYLTIVGDEPSAYSFEQFKSSPSVGGYLRAVRKTNYRVK